MVSSHTAAIQILDERVAILQANIDEIEAEIVRKEDRLQLERDMLIRVKAELAALEVSVLALQGER